MSGSGLIDLASQGITGLRELANGLFGPSSDPRDRLLRGSFRGIPMVMRGHDLTAGRRGVVHEFIGSDRPKTEDLGGVARRYNIDAFVIGADYDSRRDKLMAALFDVEGPGRLVHTWLGTVNVQVLDGCSVREQTDPARIAVFRIVCVDAGTPETTRASIDTASGLLASAAKVLGDLRLAYSLAIAVASNPGVLLGVLETGLGDLVSSVFGLPTGLVSGLVGLINSMDDTPADATATALAVSSVFLGLADAVVALAPATGDLTGGVAALADWSGIAFPVNPTITPTRAQQQVNAQALTDLVQGAAVAAIAQIYAQTDFVSSDAALAARTQLGTLIDARAEAAANAGDDASYDDWMSLRAAASADLAQRAQALPRLAAYAVPSSMASVTLAQRLLADPTQADALEDLNGVLHPMFMPPTGQWLQPV